MKTVNRKLSNRAMSILRKAHANKPFEARLPEGSAYARVTGLIKLGKRDYEFKGGSKTESRAGERYRLLFTLYPSSDSAGDFKRWDGTQYIAASEDITVSTHYNSTDVNLRRNLGLLELEGILGAAVKLDIKSKRSAAGFTYTGIDVLSLEHVDVNLPEVTDLVYFDVNNPDPELWGTLRDEDKAEIKANSSYDTSELKGYVQLWEGFEEHVAYDSAPVELNPEEAAKAERARWRKGIKIKVNGTKTVVDSPEVPCDDEDKFPLIT